MIGPAIYYLTIAVICLAISIYNLNQSQKSSSIQCFSLQEMDYFTLTKYLNSIGNKTENLTNAITYLVKEDSNSTTSQNLMILSKMISIIKANNFTSNNNTDLFFSNIVYLVPQEKSNNYLALEKGIGVVYIILLFLNFLLALSINYMSNLVPEDFIILGKVKKGFGSLCKIIPFLNIILHWIVFLLIIINWGFIGTNSCKKSISTVPGEISYSEKFFYDVWVLNTVTTAFWMLIQYGGALLRETFNQDPFMFSPLLGKGSCVKSFLIKLGP